MAKKPTTPRAIEARAVKPPSVSSLELAPEATEEGQKPFSFGGLSLTITPVSTLPVDVSTQRAGRSINLPFPELFDNMAASGKSTHFFLPDAFWEARKADPANRMKPGTSITSGFVKNKVRNAFDKWRKVAPDVRGSLRLTVYIRPHGISPNDDPSFAEDKRPGHSIYLLPAEGGA